MERAQLVIRGIEAAIRLIMQARTMRDAADVVEQLEGMAPARRADLGPIEAAARTRIGELEDVD